MKREALESFVSRLEQCCNMDTPSGCKEKLDAQAALLQKELEGAGCQVTVHERSGGNLLEFRLGAGSKQILLLGHMDTVFPVGTAAQRPFRREGNQLFGPGVLDMKAGVLMIVEIMRHFAGKLPQDVCLCGLLNADEETGSLQSAGKIMELAKESMACLCLEPSVPGHCTVQRKGIIRFQIQANGVSAHSGVNYLSGRNAILGLCNVIGRLYTLRDDEAGISVNIGGISGGSGQSNIVADWAQCRGEVRYFEPAQTQLLCEKLYAMAQDTGVQGVTANLEVEAKRPPMQQTEASRRLYEMARQAAGKNGLELEPSVRGGGSDAAYAAAAGIPVLDGMGAEGDFLHTSKEYARADTLMQRLQTCIDLIHRWIEQ